MLLELPTSWVIALNAGGIPVLQMGLAWFFSRMPAAWFERDARTQGAGAQRWYERVLRIKRWKDLMPDGASWFRRGFPKAALRDKERGHLEKFITETRRGEACHWTALAFTPVFLLWNPLWADLVMSAAMIAVNAPCIAIQRYNRIRLARVWAKSG